MISFQKIINDHNFSFREDMDSQEVILQVNVDIYSFSMVPTENGWRIFGDVPPWIFSIENRLSAVIDSELT